MFEAFINQQELSQQFLTLHLNYQASAYAVKLLSAHVAVWAAWLACIDDLLNG